MQRNYATAILALAWLPAAAVNAQTPAGELAELRQQVADLRSEYEQRISALEQRLAEAESVASGAKRNADEAMEVAEDAAISSNSGASSPNAFNPGIGAIVTGLWSDQGDGWDQVPGFQRAGEIGTGDSGFAVGEAEINLQASVDAGYYGNITFAMADGAAEVEEAWVQTTSLPAGLTLKGGRMFSGAGYLNSFHMHADDFVDRPLPYQAFLGGRYSIDGIQARWVAPSSLLVELGAELNWGDGFPASANGESSPGAWTLMAKVGGDIGISNSWQAGIARISADAKARASEAAPGEGFSGDSDLTVADFVWKWAPQGNPTLRSFKLQGEFFRRSEDGQFDGIDYQGDQDGWYMQGIFQFMPRWRVGLRYDVVNADSGALLAGTEIEDPGRNPSRSSLMFDFSPSEFSRLRMQFTNDQVLAESDSQWYLQYIMSLGAHGAHQF